LFWVVGWVVAITVMNQTMNVEIQEEKKLCKCIDGVECEGCEYFEHCSNEKVDTNSRWFKHILNNDEQFDPNNIQKLNECPLEFMCDQWQILNSNYIRIIRMKLFSCRT
jgi:hypothetical protein